MGGIGSGYNGLRKLTTTECKNIDVNKLNKGNMFREGRKTVISWDNSTIGAEYSDNILTLKYKDSKKSYRMDIYIEWTNCNYGGKRPWFNCSQCGDRVGKLYFRDMYFFCSKCQRLTYRTRQITGDQTREIDWKLRKLYERLDSEYKPGMLRAIIPDKPKYMHWKTYSDITLEIKKLYNDRLRAFISGAQRIINKR